MAEKSVTGEQLLKDAETYFARATELTRHVRLHQHLLPAVNQGLQDLIELNEARPRIECGDLLKAYRRVRGLIFIGPAEWERACLGAKKENPLDLEEGWCHKLAPPIPYPIEVIKGVMKYCRTPEWNTTPILWLVLPEIISAKFGKIPTTLIGQNRLWGVAHDDRPAGLVRQDVFYFVKPNYDWANEVVAESAEWAVGYEHVGFTAFKNWSDQQIAVRSKKGLQLVSAPKDALMLNLVIAATGKRLRSVTYSRTTTIFDGGPLDVCSNSNGVGVFRGWHSENRLESLAASVQGVLEL